MLGRISKRAVSPETAGYSKSLFFLTGLLSASPVFILSLLGNPANTGFCVSCFMENIAGSIGFMEIYGCST